MCHHHIYKHMYTLGSETVGVGCYKLLNQLSSHRSSTQMFQVFIQVLSLLLRDKLNPIITHGVKVTSRKSQRSSDHM